MMMKTQKLEVLKKVKVCFLTKAEEQLRNLNAVQEQLRILKEEQEQLHHLNEAPTSSFACIEEKEECESRLIYKFQSKSNS